MATQSEETRGSLDELTTLLTEFDDCMLITITPDRMIRARPMAIQEPGRAQGGDLWFFTSDESGKVQEISHEQNVGVACFRPSDRAWLSISGTAVTERDPDEIRRLWNASATTYFPKGPDDPHLAIVKVKISRAEYWAPAGGRLRVLYDIMKARVRGRSADQEMPPVKHI